MDQSPDWRIKTLSQKEDSRPGKLQLMNISGNKTSQVSKKVRRKQPSTGKTTSPGLVSFPCHSVAVIHFYLSLQVPRTDCSGAYCNTLLMCVNWFHNLKRKWIEQYCCKVFFIDCLEIPSSLLFHYSNINRESLI